MAIFISVWYRSSSLIVCNHSWTALAIRNWGLLRRWCSTMKRSLLPGIYIDQFEKREKSIKEIRTTSGRSWRVLFKVSRARFHRSQLSRSVCNRRILRDNCLESKWVWQKMSRRNGFYGCRPVRKAMGWEISASAQHFWQWIAIISIQLLQSCVTSESANAWAYNLYSCCSAKIPKFNPSYSFCHFPTFRHTWNILRRTYRCIIGRPFTYIRRSC